MPINKTPTRANLIKNKAKLEFSEKGYDLLDKKRTVLIQEIIKLVDEAKRIEDEIQETFAQAYEALRESNITLGISNVEDYALSVENEEDYQVLTRSIMGVDIPELNFPEEEKTAPLAVTSNSPTLDEVIQKFNKAKELSYELTEVENKAFKLSQEIKKTSKSANALSKLQIPRLNEAIAYIQNSIEEKDREEHFRIKKVKKKKARA